MWSFRCGEVKTALTSHHRHSFQGTSSMQLGFTSHGKLIIGDVEGLQVGLKSKCSLYYGC